MNVHCEKAGSLKKAHTVRLFPREILFLLPAGRVYAHAIAIPVQLIMPMACAA